MSNGIGCMKRFAPLLAYLAWTVVASQPACAEETAKSVQPWFVDQRRVPDVPATQPAAPPDNTTDAAATGAEKLPEARRELEELSERLKADEKRLQEREAEAQRKVEDLQRQYEQAEEKLKSEQEAVRQKALIEKHEIEEAAKKLQAEEERIRANHAETAAKSAELERLAAEAEAKRKAEEEKLSATQAETRKQVDELHRITSETAAKRQELEKELEQQKGSEQVGSKSKASERASKDAGPEGVRDGTEQSAIKDGQRAAVLNIPPVALECPQAQVSVAPSAGGRAAVTVLTKCRTGQVLMLKYGPIAMPGVVDAGGKAEILVDMFLGNEAGAELIFADDSTAKVKLPAGDLDQVTKIAVLWDAPVNIDLHAFEYAAAANDPGHVWAGMRRDGAAAQTMMKQEARGRGFLSTASDEKQPGTKVEVFTFWQAARQTHGTIGMALDYETRGDTPSGATCGEGQYARLPIEVVVREPGGQMKKQSGILAAVPCGKTLAGAARYQSGLIPDIRIHN